MAVRVGTALRLGQENQQTISPYELQIRRRLWYCIGLLDTHGSFDRGTLPMLRLSDLGPAPLLLSDNELSAAAVPTSSSPGFGDMYCFGLMSRAMVCNRSILSVPDNMEDGWAARLQVVLAFEKSIKQDYFNISEDAPLLAKFAKQAANGMIVGMHLILRRPPYKQYSKVVPASDDFDVLEHATRVLENELKIKSAEFAPWAWKSWVQWHALAIVLAELCSQPTGERSDTIYSIAVQSFNRYASLIADTETGMLWKPIAKLMRRLEQLRNACRVSEPVSNAATMIDVNESMGFASLDPWVINYGLDSNTGAENLFIPEDHQITATYGDPQLNWSIFIDDLNTDYPIGLDINNF